MSRKSGEILSFSNPYASNITISLQASLRAHVKHGCHRIKSSRFLRDTQEDRSRWEIPMKRATSSVFLVLVLTALCLSCSQQKQHAADSTKHPQKKYSPDQLPKLTGLVVPQNLPQLVQRSNKLSAQLVKTVKQTAPNVGSTIDHQFCSPSDQVVDFRALNLVS